MSKKKVWVSLYRKTKFRKIRNLPANAKITAVVLILAVLAVAIFFVYPKDTVVATVNGEKLYAKRVDAVFNSLPADSNLKKNTVMWRLIDELVLLDYLKKGNYWLDDETFNEIVSRQLAETGLTYSQLKEELRARGATLDSIRTTLMIQNFIEAEIAPNIHITEEEIDLYIMLNKVEGITRDEVRQIIYTNHQKTLIDKIIKSHSETLDIWVSEEYRMMYRETS